MSEAMSEAMRMIRLLPYFLPRFCALRRDDRAVSIIEFAFTAPIFLLALMGALDYSWQFYGKSVLVGAVNEAARASTLSQSQSAANRAILDDNVSTQVRQVFSDAQLTFSRKAYGTFDSVSNPELFTDTNGNNSYDSGECFEDINGNETWDSDRASTGNGGSSDVILYEVDMVIERVLPVWRMLGQPQELTLTASSLLRNQPYDAGSETQSEGEVICDS